MPVTSSTHPPPTHAPNQTEPTQPTPHLGIHDVRHSAAFNPSLILELSTKPQAEKCNMWHCNDEGFRNVGDARAQTPKHATLSPSTRCSARTWSMLVLTRYPLFGWPHQCHRTYTHALNQVSYYWLPNRDQMPCSANVYTRPENSQPAVSLVDNGLRPPPPQKKHMRTHAHTKPKTRRPPTRSSASNLSRRDWR
jgi:hypothetical protein